MPAICESLSTAFDRCTGFGATTAGLLEAEARAILTGAAAEASAAGLAAGVAALGDGLAFTGASGAVGATAAWASAIGESDLGLKRVIPPSAEANAKVRGAGSQGASVQSAGNRRFTVSDGGISAKVRATVEDGSAGSPARVL